MDKHLNQLFMPVEKVPVKDILPDYEPPKGKDHAIIVYSDDGKKRIANLCSDGYGLISNKELILPLMETLDSHKFEYTTQVRNFDDRKFFVDFIFGKEGIDFGYGKKPDKIVPKITWRNSYDLSLKYGLMAGIWRMVCSNGMMAPDQESFKSIKKLHTVNFAEISLTETVDLIHEFLRDSKMIMEPFQALRDRRILQDELEEFLEEIIDYTGFPKKQKEMVLQRIIEEKAITNTLDGWIVYNGFNYQLNHNEEINLAPQKLHKMDMELVEAIAYS